MGQGGLDVYRSVSVHRFWYLAVAIFTLVFGMIATAQQALALSSACQAFTNYWGASQTLGPGAERLPGPFGVYATGEKIFYSAYTANSSPAELAGDEDGRDAGIAVVADNADVYDEYGPGGGAEMNVSGTLNLGPTLDYTLEAFGSKTLGSLGSVTVQATCYGDPPTITSISRDDGPLSGGAPITLTGQNLTGVSAVSFGGVAATVFTVDSDDQITVTPPSASKGAVNITVTSLGGTSAATPANTYRYYATPVVTTVSPDRGPSSSGTSVTITGSEFTDLTSVSFGTAPATGYTFINDGQITATAPSGAGTVNITVTTPGGTSAATAQSAFTYVAAPTITQLDPVEGPVAGGTSVTISGSNFIDVSGVSFGGAAATSYVRNNDNEIVAVAPAGSGTVAVAVTAFGGSSVGGPTFRYVDPPTVTSISPGEGPEGGGTPVTITGTNLANATVRFGSTAGTVTSNNGSQIIVTSPAGTGTSTISVSTAGGTVTAGTFTYLPAPVISGLLPAEGPLAGGNTVVISGTGFTGATSVNFGGTVITGVSGTDTELSVSAPAGAAGVVTVAVTTPGGTSVVTPGSAYTYLAVPTVSSLSRSSGPLGGGTAVTITGTGFTPGATVQFGGVSATSVIFGSASSLTATSPSGSAGPVNVIVTTAGGVSAAGPQFTYVTAPIATNSSAVVAANSSNAAIVPTISGGTADSVAVVTPTANGTIAASGTTFLYTPNPGYSGTDSFTFTATNAGGPSAAAQITITVTAPTLVLSPASGALPAGQAATPYSQTITASAGTAPYTFAITTGAAPAGITLDSATGALSGTTTVPGPASFTVTATDAYGATGTAAYTLAIAEQPPVANAVSATVAIGSSNNLITLSISGGVAASVAIDTQATNGAATASGTTITYTPNPGYSGPDSFRYTATNSAGTSLPATATITVAIPTFTFSPPAGALPVAAVGSAYSQQITAAGGSGSYSYAVTTGALPAGLTLTSAGVIEGTPTSVGTSSFTITATDTVSAFGAVSYTLEVALPPPVASNVSLTVAANSGATSVPLALSGGAAASVAVATVPAHGTATVSGTGISYTPAAGYSGTDSFTYTATNPTATSAPATVTITVTAPALAFSPAAGALPGATVATAYSQTFVASNGTAPYSYAISSGAAPAGMTLDPSTGALTGTPTAAGPSSFSVTATDVYGAIGSSAYTLDVAVQPPVANPVAATVVRGSAGNPITLNITGGPASSVAVTAGPSNGSIGISGATITYTPTPGYVGSDSFDYTATNASGTSAPATVSITVINPTLVLAPAAGPLPDGTVGNAYNQALSASGGTAPYDFAVTGGSLPTGLVIAPGSNTIAGTPGAAGIYNVSITATDAGGATGTATYSLRILAAALVLSPPTGSGLPPATTGLAYSYTGISVSGGSGPASFAASGLPAGLVMAGGGAISGTPTTAGSYSITVTATDTAGAVATAVYELTVHAGTGDFGFSPPGGALPQAMVGEAYFQDISASGGTAPLIYSVVSGNLPAGLVLNISNGDLNGPLAADVPPGTYNFTIGVRDAAGVTGSVSFALQVVPRAVTVANKEVTVAPGGTPPNVYLNAGATGGPFVDAAIGEVSPPSAGTAELIRGELAQAGPVAPSGFYLRFTPNPGFSGRAVVGYRLISAFGTSNIGTVAYNLNFNAVAVADDIDELVHDFVRTRQNLLSSTIRVPGLLERRRMENARDPVTIRMSPQEDGMRASFSTSLAQIEAARDRADGLDAAGPRPFNLWIDGAIRVHGRGDNDEEDDRWGSFALLSVGMDYLLSDRTLIGISAHFDRMTDPADEDAELTGNGWFAGPYVSLEIAKGVFFDTSLLYGGSWNDIDTPFFDGKFDTTRWMWDGSLKGEWYLDEATVITPKLRAVYLTETVKDYAVSNDAGDKLLLEGFSMEQLRASIGAEIERRVVLSNGMVLTPRLGATVGVAGLDGDGTFATVTAGASLQTETAWMFDLALLFDIEGEGDVSVGARARMSTRF
ncbi:putative Ig domain-containing protein [Rhizobium panacihumi]|uniref:putative Ig domain-containing protein n=1 Tax=Rhizobium panacihumi TaxID=2008450 RepID=UPI003D78BB86